MSAAMAEPLKARARTMAEVVFCMMISWTLGLGCAEFNRRHVYEQRLDKKFILSRTKISDSLLTHPRPFDENPLKP
jgi:hypothetical protein